MTNTKINTETAERKNNLLLDILRDAFPGRDDSQILPIGLVYAGLRWGGHHYCVVPQGAQSEQIKQWFAENDDRYWRMSGKKDEKIDADALREDYASVAAEMQEHQRLCPTVHLADVPWRAPLAIAVQKAATPNEQAEIIVTFYEAYNKYVM